MKVFSIEHSKSAYFVDFAVYLAAIVLLPLFLVHFAPLKSGPRLPFPWSRVWRAGA